MAKLQIMDNRRRVFVFLSLKSRVSSLPSSRREPHRCVPQKEPYPSRDGVTCHEVCGGEQKGLRDETMFRVMKKQKPQD